MVKATLNKFCLSVRRRLDAEVVSRLDASRAVCFPQQASAKCFVRSTFPYLTLLVRRPDLPRVATLALKMSQHHAKVGPVELRCWLYSVFITSLRSTTSRLLQPHDHDIRVSGSTWEHSTNISSQALPLTATTDGCAGKPIRPQQTNVTSSRTCEQALWGALLIPGTSFKIQLYQPEADVMVLESNDGACRPWNACTRTCQAIVLGPRSKQRLAK